MVVYSVNKEVVQNFPNNWEKADWSEVRGIVLSIGFGLNRYDFPGIRENAFVKTEVKSDNESNGNRVKSGFNHFRSDPIHSRSFFVFK